MSNFWYGVCFGFTACWTGWTASRITEKVSEVLSKKIAEYEIKIAESDKESSE